MQHILRVPYPYYYFMILIKDIVNVDVMVDFVVFVVHAAYIWVLP